MTRLVAERDQPHIRSASNERGTDIPLSAGKAQAGETNLNLGWLGHVLGPVAHPDLPGLIRSQWTQEFRLARFRQNSIDCIKLPPELFFPHTGLD